MEDDKNVPSCPFCGVDMAQKPKVLERDKFECPCCGYSELMFNRIETAIVYGKMDDPIIKQMARDLCFRDLQPISEEAFEEERY